MKWIKPTVGTVTLFILLLSYCLSYSQSPIPYDSTTGKTNYKFTIELDKSFKKENLYSLVQDWFTKSTEPFNRSNTTDSVVPYEKKKNENKVLVEKEFTNHSPLQSLDPESNRVTGKVISKYLNQQNACMRLFYVQYFVVVQVEEHRLNCEINDIRYNHYNPKTYTSQRIYNWSNTSNCDPVSTIEYLRNCEQCHDEFNAFASYLNSDISDLMYHLGQFLKTNKAITLNTVAN